MKQNGQTNKIAEVFYNEHQGTIERTLASIDEIIGQIAKTGTRWQFFYSTASPKYYKSQRASNFEL